MKRHHYLALQRTNEIIERIECGAGATTEELTFLIFAENQTILNDIRKGRVQMANENAAQEDADIQALTAQINTFLTQLTAFLNGLPAAGGTLTDAQQADLTRA